MAKKSVSKFLVISVIVLSIWVNTGCGAVTPVLTKTPITTATQTSTLVPVLTATLAPIPTTSSSTVSTFSMQRECRVIVDGLYNLKRDLELPEHFMSENPFRQASDFDPNLYFQVLSHLDIVAGYKLDYIYYKDDLGGFPLVYALGSNSSPFQSYTELLNSFGEDISEIGVVSYGHLPHQRDYLDKIRIDKSPESYLEYLALWLLVDQFYLWKRGLYNDQKILCDISDMKYVYEDMENFGLEFPQSVEDSIEQIDLTPIVIINETSIKVRFVTFTKWSGFSENVYVLEKENPGHWLDVELNQLIEYHCGINF